MKPPHAVSACARRRCGVALTLAALLFGAGSPAARAFTFTVGQVQGSFDSTLSIGTLYRLDNPDPSLYGTSNAFNGIPGLANSVNGDDGDLNYPQGVVSVVAKGTHDLELKLQNWDLFVRGYYFYDFRNNTADKPHTPLSKLALERVGSDAVLLDNYITGKFELGGMPTTVRLGRQVVSWGESTFIPNGINVINPIDVSRLRTPGSELREALLPVYAWDTSIALTDKLSLEALWLLEFRHTELDPDGTYFSTNDFASRGGNRVMLGFGALSDLQSLGAIPRGPDRGHSKFGQWGLALRYMAPGLGNTEFGFYYLKYSSRLPLISAVTPTSPVAPFVPGALASLLIQNGAATPDTAAAIAGQLLTLYATNPGLLNAQQQALIAGAQKIGFLNAAATGRYFLDYPADIDLFGVSFNTDVGTTGVALQGEISYKRNVPLQVDDVELLFATLSSLNPVYGTYNQIGNFYNQLGLEVPGYRRLDVWQAQVTATKVFGRMLGADQLTVLTEVGATLVPQLPDKNVLRFDGTGTNTAGFVTEMVATGNGAFPPTPFSAFPDRFSCGFQAVGRLDYNNLFAGINLSPSVAYSQDIRGNTPLPLGNFLNGRRTLTLGADFVFQNQWALELRYVDFFGDKPYNPLADRDYVSATLKVSF
ncbi:MAG TPA: DUF1302 domain-containing protein [Opitutaceae bacterium]|nr:DUF1302 domain-containing protein [Opitutaceae bacterium]